MPQLISASTDMRSAPVSCLDLLKQLELVSVPQRSGVTVSGAGHWPQKHRLSYILKEY
jgi:hypothetical protein